MSSSMDHHYFQAKRLAERAEHWMDADEGWKADLGGEQRVARQHADAALAQVHATLALMSLLHSTIRTDR